MGKHVTVLHDLAMPAALDFSRPELHKQHVHVHVVNQAQNDAQVSHLAQATLLNWLGQAPISFHRIYVDLTGSVVSGLWLSHVLAKAASAKASDFFGDDFVFTMSARDCEAVTGITRGQQVNCRKTLTQLGLLSEEGRQRKTPIYRLHLDKVAVSMMRESRALADTLACRAAHVDS